jgi:hypothetical protein
MQTEGIRGNGIYLGTVVWEGNVVTDGDLGAIIW